MLGDHLCLADHSAPKQGPPAGNGNGLEGVCTSWKGHREAEGITGIY